jgi:hypothetical protein
MWLVDYADNQDASVDPLAAQMLAYGRLIRYGGQKILSTKAACPSWPAAALQMGNVGEKARGQE